MEREPEQLEFEFMNELEHLEAQKQLLEDEDYDQMASSSGC